MPDPNSFGVLSSSHIFFIMYCFTSIFYKVWIYIVSSRNFTITTIVDYLTLSRSISAMGSSYSCFATLLHSFWISYKISKVFYPCLFVLFIIFCNFSFTIFFVESLWIFVLVFTFYFYYLFSFLIFFLDYFSTSLKASALPICASHSPNIVASFGNFSISSSSQHLLLLQHFQLGQIQL